MKFRKKPVVIDAFQFTLSQLTNEPLQWGPVLRAPEGGPYYIETLEGKMEVTPGDWVIRGIAGEYSACKPDIFERTYDAVDG